MITYEDFKKVWKDSSRESILNQFYYEHNELFRIQKEVREYIENTYKDYKNEDGSLPLTLQDQELLEILDKENNNEL